MITKNWYLVDAVGHAKPIIADGQRAQIRGHVSRQAIWEGRLMWLVNLSIAIAAWIAVCAAVIKLVEALP